MRDLKRKKNGRQFSYLSGIWEAVVPASVKVDHEQNKKLKDCMDQRLITVIEKNCSCTGGV